MMLKSGTDRCRFMSAAVVWRRKSEKAGFLPNTQFRKPLLFSHFIHIIRCAMTIALVIPPMGFILLLIQHHDIIQELNPHSQAVHNIKIAVRI